MDILIVTQDFPPERGGIQTFMLELSRAMIDLGHRVRVICPGKKTDANPLPPNPQTGFLGLTELIRIPIHSSWLFVPLLGYLPHYLKKNPTLEVVLYAQWQSALSGFLISKKTISHRSYCFVYGRELLTSVLGPFAPILRKKVFGKLTAVFPISAEIMQLTKSMAPPTLPLHLVHPGVDPNYFKPVDANFLRIRYGIENSAVIFSITRMVARKNLRNLIAALPQVLKSVPNAKLVLAGNGPEKKNLEAQVVLLGLQNEVQFLGHISDTERVAHYCMAQVFALPSLSLPRDIEGFGIVFLEAGACEVAVVGSLAGGIPDAVEAGVGGLLVPPADTEKLALALIQILQNTAMANEMGRAARRRIEQHFTWSHIAQKTLALMH